MSASSRQVWIAVTSGTVATMTMLGIVGWKGGHPEPYYWTIVVILTVACVIAGKNYGGQNTANKRAGWQTHDIGDGSPAPQRTKTNGAQYAGQ